MRSNRVQGTKHGTEWWHWNEFRGLLPEMREKALDSHTWNVLHCKLHVYWSFILSSVFLFSSQSSAIAWTRITTTVPPMLTAFTVWRPSSARAARGSMMCRLWSASHQERPALVGPCDYSGIPVYVQRDANSILSWLRFLQKKERYSTLR